MKNSSDKNGHRTWQKIDRLMAAVAVISVAAVWFAGLLRSEADILPHFQKLVPEAERFEKISSLTYSAVTKNNSENSSGNFALYVSAGSANGYGGEMRIAVAVDSTGTVADIGIINHRETVSFLRRVIKNDFIESLKGKLYSDRFELKNDVEGVTGATYTSRAIAGSVKKAVREVAGNNLRLTVPEEPSPKIKFGIPEIVLVLLYAAGFLGIKSGRKMKKIFRWGAMLTGLIVIGFWYNAPLNLVFLNKFLLGFWPEWQTHLYWYLLIGGIVFVLTVDNKNPYCEWICPFGCAQECFGLIGGAKVRTPREYKTILIWVQRGLAWLAVLLAVFYRNPSVSSYEVFGTFFELLGSDYMFALLGIVLVASIFLHRPWCGYLCPLRPITDIIRLFRNWIKEIWIKTVTPKIP